jgi:NAD(P)-dependent dehydrogenase (short-subunit alcohol dehydrogenase family)
MSDLSKIVDFSALARSAARIEGKTAVVTGGTRGIGRALVELFHRHGADVVFTGRDETLGAQVARETGAAFFAADAVDVDATKRLVEFCAARSGRIDVLVNNAGHSAPRDSVLEFKDADLDAMIDVHVRAPWRTIAETAPLMAKTGGGSIINIASLAAHRVGANSIAYALAKAALVHLTRHAAAALGKDRIRVNSVSPGYIDTEIHTAGLTDDPDRQQMYAEAIARFHSAKQAVPMIAKAEDVAALCLYLASDDSRFMSGADLLLEGASMWGQVAR